MDRDGTHVPRQKRFTRDRGAVQAVRWGQVFVPRNIETSPHDQGSDQDAHGRDHPIEVQD